MDARRTPTNTHDGNAAADALHLEQRLSDTVHDTIDRMVDSGHPALDRLAEQAHDTVQRVSAVASKASEGMQAHAAQAKEAQAALAEDCRDFVRTHPFKALAYAAVAGFVLTRLLRD